MFLYPKIIHVFKKSRPLEEIGEDILMNPIEGLMRLPEMQGAGCVAVVGYRKYPATQQIR